jgi:hypothetical protein
MIDYIKSTILAPPEFLTSNPNLLFAETINVETGEIIPDKSGYRVRWAKFGEMIIAIKTNLTTDKTNIELTGSIHKHFTNGYNNTDYSFTQVCKSINDICHFLNLTPDKFILHNVEFGVNINTIHLPMDIIDSIIAHRVKKFEFEEYNGMGYLKRFALSQYEIKIYDKSRKPYLPYNLLRYEIKVKTMQFLRNKGCNIHSLQDLLNPEIHPQLSDILLMSLSDLFMFDYRINLQKVKKLHHRLVLTEGINTEFWNKFRKEHTPKGFAKRKDRFKHLVNLYAPDDLSLYLMTEIRNKWSYLQNSTNFLALV